MKTNCFEISYKPNLMASLEGFEPTTRCLEGSRSVQLSYRDNQATLKFYDKRNDKTSRSPTAFGIYLTLYRCIARIAVTGCLSTEGANPFELIGVVFWDIIPDL